MRTLVAEVADLFAPPAHHKDLEIGWTADSAVPRGLLGDALRVRQLLCNLISNARKFTASDSIRIHLSLGAPGHLHFEVRDTGRGVPPDRAQAIFAPFVSDAVGDERAHSTGLGLPICRKLARLMGGDVVLRSSSCR